MGVVTRCIRFVIAIFGFFLVDVLSSIIFSVFYFGGRKTIPAPKSPILLLSATELARKIRQRELRCSEVIDAYIQRILEVNPVVNAVVADRFDEARREAEHVDTVLDSGDIGEDYSEDVVPLLGVPFTAKEAFAITGMPNTSGLVSRKNVTASSDAAVVATMRKAGGIPLALTNCSELCMWYESSNNVYGTTCNPYDTSRMVGGSSGGEGCILSCAGSVIGIGSDIGGSIRMPAFFNGIFGHKPTTGIVDCDGQFPNAEGEEKEFLVTGPMCRYAGDLAPVLKVMAEENVTKLNLDSKVDIKTLKFYSMEDDGGCMLVSKVDPELKQAQEKVISHLESSLGITVERLNIRQFKLSAQLWTAKMASCDSPSFSSLLGGGTEIKALWELLKWTVRCSDHTLPAIGLAIGEKLADGNAPENKKLVKICNDFQADLDKLLQNNAVLLYPSHPKPAPFHYQPLLMPFNFAYTAIFNVLGVPVTQCPVGLSDQGLPVGLQVVSGKYNDHLTIAVAQELEKVFGGWISPGV